MCSADPSDVADRGSQVLVIARHEKAAPTVPETRERGAFLLTDAITAVDRKEPDLVEVRFVDRSKRRVFIAARDVVPIRLQQLMKHAETGDRPVVGRWRNRGLKKDAHQGRVLVLLRPLQEEFRMATRASVKDEDKY